MSIKITITNAGSGISNLLDIYSGDGMTYNLYIANVTKADLLTGYVFTADPGAIQYKVMDQSCGTSLELLCVVTTTTTPIPTTTTTTLPTLTTTTTNAVLYYNVSGVYNSLNSLDLCNSLGNIVSDIYTHFPFDNIYSGHILYYSDGNLYNGSGFYTNGQGFAAVYGTIVSGVFTQYGICAGTTTTTTAAPTTTTTAPPTTTSTSTSTSTSTTTTTTLAPTTTSTTTIMYYYIGRFETCYSCTYLQDPNIKSINEYTIGLWYPIYLPTFESLLPKGSGAIQILSVGGSGISGEYSDLGVGYVYQNCYGGGGAVPCGTTTTTSTTTIYSGPATSTTTPTGLIE